MPAMSRKNMTGFVGDDEDPETPVVPEIGRAYEDLSDELRNVTAALREASVKAAGLREERLTAVRKNKPTDAIAAKIAATDSDVQALTELSERIEAEMAVRLDLFNRRRRLETDLLAAEREVRRLEYIDKAVLAVEALAAVEDACKADPIFKDTHGSGRIDSALTSFVRSYRVGSFGPRLHFALRHRRDTTERVSTLKRDVAAAKKAEAGRS